MTDILSSPGVGTGKKYSNCLKYAGGKGHLVPELLPYWDQHSHKRLVEPFCGSLAVAFALKPERVLANDINTNLINFYQQMQIDPKLSMVKMINEEKYYYQCREEFNQNIRDYPGTLIFLAPETVKRKHAELFYYLNRYCFNGLSRYNSKDEFNVSFGKYPYSKGQVDLSSFFAGTEQWEFVSVDFAEIVLKPDDFIFADPPYLDTFTGYNKLGFTYEDQERLCKWLEFFGQNKPQIIANKNHPEIISLYTNYGYEIIETKRPKSFRGKATLESKREILATRNVSDGTVRNV